jgi:hypothetical protein
MPTDIAFRGPDGHETVPAPRDRTAPLTQANQALESSRDSGFDLSAAAGEVVDNSIQAGATRIRVATTRNNDGDVVSVAFSDDGEGIPDDVLPHVLSLGYSSRYGSREGMGRFGMGLKLASLSHARRADVYTWRRGEDGCRHTYLDLDEVAEGSQTELEAWPLTAVPADVAALITDDRGSRYRSGTVVVWDKIDRLRNGGRSHTSGVEEKLTTLTKFLGRTYRRFLDGGLQIELDGNAITLHDPLFQLPNPRATQRFGSDLRSRIVDSETVTVDGHPVEVTVTLLPRELRPKEGGGGRAAKGREEFKDLNIPDNEGKISILRENREIYYEIIPKLLPGGVDRIDRYIGVEVSFPAELDEYFQVRNVKRGAEPVSKLREDLKKFLKKPVEQARKEIREYWQEVKRNEAAEKGSSAGHEQAQDAVDAAEQTAPPGRGGLDATPEQVDAGLDSLFSDMGLDEDPETAEDRKQAFRDSWSQRRVMLVDGAWPGKDMFDIKHLSGKAVVQLNHRHPFISDVYDVVKDMASRDVVDLGPAEIKDLLARTQVAMDVLFMAYGKAENMHDDPDDAYGNLRSQWGIFAASYVREALER